MRLDAAAALLVGAGSIAAQAYALRFHGFSYPAPWRWFLGASVVFLAGVTVRPWAVTQDGPAMLAGDVLTNAGYLMLAAGLVLLVRFRGLERHALTDGVIVCLGAGVLALQFLALPAATVGDRPQVISLLAGLYPMWDVVILLLVLNLGFSTAIDLPPFRLFAAAMTALLVGDLGYAWIGAGGELVGHELLDVPFLLGFTLVAAAALHPRADELSTVTTRRIQPWAAARLLLIGPALAAPILVVSLVHLPPAGRLMVGGTAVALMVLLLYRALSAVRGHTEVQRDLRHRATHDPLTGLPNRALLLEENRQLLDAVRRGEEDAWMLFLDLDGFKTVNDHWGHEVGDALLVEVSRRLTGLVGDVSRQPARISGDEFVVAGRGELAVAVDLAGAIRRELARPVLLAGTEIPVRASIGIAATGAGSTADTLLRDADLAMYHAKADALGGFRVYDAAIRRAVDERVEVELALRHALAAGQIRPAYQPIVRIGSGELVGCEALLRWDHPVLGTVPPNRFVPVAESSGLIQEIGGFALDEALRQYAAWRADGLLPERFRVSVNASTRQLRDDVLVRRLRAGLAAHAVPAEAFVLEITESVMLADSDAVRAVLAAVRELGVGLSVDDFGTGYSSLAYLSRFPVTAVKIDRSFVAGLGADPSDDAVVRSVTGLAAALQLQVVAEGVETHEQRRALGGLDVAYGQGFLWAPALGADEFAARWLPARRPLAHEAADGGNS